MSKKLLAGVLGAAAMAFGAVTAQAEETKIGFVYVSPIGDAGYTYQHDLGRKAIEEKFGDKIKVSFVESVAEGPDAERVIMNFAKNGYKAVFATSFGYMNPTLKVAKRFPKMAFEHATGYKRSKNMNTYLARFYESRYLTGLVAGAMTKSNVIGYVAAFPIPEVVRGINAFTRGIRAVNDKAEVRVIWTNSWFDPGKEREAADTLIGQKSDVLTMHADSPATIQAAEDAGVYAIGYNSDFSKFGPKSHLTASITNWAPYYVKRVEEVLAGNWKGNQDTWDGLNVDMVQVGPFHADVPKDVQERVMKAKADIIAGKLHPFGGPVKDNEGKERIAAGKTMSDGEMLGFNWYVEGVVGKLPN
ncbi:Purine-binding protein BAB2_0673 [Candidatus Terasakiella magnetica]|uniref:Purine-binding protein BAB2_0673 n=1 Tax=Candidatus Terasakiella magnetica TaxID=1867952 RepID=A0A1C3RG29_9PROT|nr:BMP family ABC transporter substrate-binding protein [Candidatus Terasakiella magnetica]SCA56174.1 Purine-binding protein BAB2_0673 [Candidatus Terasakiella magnetica]